MKKRITVLLMFLLLGISSNTYSQILRPVRWRWRVEKVSDNVYNLIFKARIQRDWSLYSQNIKEGGPVATTFNFDKGDFYELIGKPVESDNVETVHDKVFDMQIKKFHHNATFTQKIKVLDKSKKLTGYINFMTCDDTRCLPPTDADFTFDFKEWDRAFNHLKPVERKVEKAPAAINSKKEESKKKIESTETKVKKVKQLKATVDKTKKTVEPENKIVASQTVNTEPKQKKSSGNSSRKKLEPVKWSFEVEKLSDNERILRFIATMEKNWDIYSIYTEDNGPIPTSINYENKDGIELIGKPVEKGHLKEGLDPMFGVDVKKFLWEEPYVVEQKIKVKDASKPLDGYISYQSCDDERCLFLEKNFAVDLKENRFVDNSEEIGMKNAGQEKKVVSDDANPNTKYKFDKALIETACGSDDLPDENKKASSWWLIFLLGFGGGLLAFLTPCVFPMVPLTVSYFTKRSGSRAKGIRNALYYGLSIIVIYVIMGLAVTGIFGADALNQLSTNVYFNIGFAILFIIFAFSFFGYFEITLPSSWANKSDAMASKGGMLGIFFMAFTLALVSFSCTGPIIGTLLVETATGGGPTIFGSIPVGPLFGMLGFSTALALPFALFAMFPAWLNSMPKSGSWMNVIKVTLGFIEIALAFKFISIADLTMGWKILPYELFVGIWILVALLMAAYYFGILRFPLDPPKQKISLVRKAFGVLMVGLALYFATGFRVSERSETFITPNMLSGLAPPAGHSYIYPKHCPLNINCFHDYDEGMEYAKEQNKPVLLDFTGYGCVNCRRMEDNVWSQDKVYKLINDDYVLISLYVDEKKALEKPYYSEFGKKKIRTIGNKWSDFQAMHFDRNSQPFYVLMAPDGRILNKPVAYTPDVDKYKAFLECGLNNFKK